MIEHSRGLSYVRYTVDSEETRFHLPFDYLDRAHVSATTQQGEARFNCALTWVDAQTVEITPPAGEYVLVIRRTTPVDREWVEYREGSRLPARDLRRSFQQLLYAHQEALEGGVIRQGGGDGSAPPPGGGHFEDLDELIDKIVKSPALKDLITGIDPIERAPILQDILDRIELIDLNAMTLLEDIVRSTHFHDITRQHGDKISQVKHELTLLEEAGKVTATSLTELYATVAGVETTQQAHYQELITAIADEVSARVTAFNELHAQMVAGDSAVSAALTQQISEAEATAEAARASLKTQLQAQITGGDNAVKAALNHRIDEAVTDAESALASSTAHLQAQIDEGDAATAALSQHVNTVEANAASARASLKDQLQAQMTDGDTAVSTALNLQLNEVATTAEQSLASAVDVLNAQITSSGEVVSDALNARVDIVEANAASALATTETTLMAQMADNNAAMQQQVNTKINATQAETIAQTKVQAFQDGNFALLQQEFNVVAGEHAGMYGQWQANYSVKINAGTVGGQPVVAGIALSANPQTGSDFIVMADRFAVVPPSYTNSTQTKMPFVVGQVNGVNTVGIQGQLLVDGSITANKISVNTLSAVTANAGTINGGTFKTHTLDANGNVANPTEFRAEMSNVGNWPLWIGSGTKTANNSVMWVDKQGNAEFKGKIKAGNVVGQFQAATAVDWQGSIPLDFLSGNSLMRHSDYQVITTFALPPPLQVGEIHTPSIMLGIDLNFKEGLTASVPTLDNIISFGVEVILEEFVGSVWKTVYIHRSQEAKYKLAQPGIMDSVVTFIDTVMHVGNGKVLMITNGSPTASESLFRIRTRFIDNSTIYNVQANAAIHKVIGVKGHVFGIR